MADKQSRAHIVDPLAPIPPSRHPFQFWVLAACNLAGWVTLIKDPDTLLAQSVPHLIYALWGLLLVMSSSIGLISAWWPDRITGLLLERAGLLALGVGAAAYGSLLLHLVGWRAGLAGPMTVGIGIASLWRVVHVNREIKVLVRLIESRRSMGTEGDGGTG